jgi:solute carrier family 13 (sodium-dependent dicarboxylate transporter), member 2/3/5
MKRFRNFIASLVAAAGITWLLHEPSFTQPQILVLFLLMFSVGLWVSEATPPFAVGLFIIAFLVFTMGYEKFTDTPVDVKIYLNTFSNSVIWLMMGGFFLAAAMTKTKLDIDLVHLTLKVCGTNPKRVLFGLMMITMAFSMVISNTATTAMVIAAAMPLVRKLGRNSPASKAFLLGTPIAAATGGMGTIIGSPPNAIAAGALAHTAHPVHFITWILYGVPVMLLLTLVSWWVLVRFFMKNEVQLPLEDLVPVKSEFTQDFRLKRWTVIAIFSVTLLLWLTGPLHKVGAAAVSAVPLVLFPITGILKGEEIRSIGWDTLILVAGGLALGIGLQQTGLLDHYAGSIASLHVPRIAFYFLLAYATMFLSNIMSNTATSTVLIPLGMSILPGNVTEACMIVGLAASTALFLPVSTPPNAIAFSTGMVEQKDFRIGGLLIGLLGPAMIVLWVLLIT